MPEGWPEACAKGRDLTGSGRGGRRLRIYAAGPWGPQVTAAFTRLVSLSPG